MNPEQHSQSAPAPAPAVAKKNIGMAVLAYLSVLVIVSYLAAKDDAS
jgi:cytochrome c1